MPGLIDQEEPPMLSWSISGQGLVERPDVVLGIVSAVAFQETIPSAKIQSF
jgi:hypothetical protein